MAAHPDIEGDDPAPAGMQYLSVGLNVRGTLTDRGTRPPAVLWLDVQWPDPDCHTYDDDSFRCSSADANWDFVTDYIPVDAEEFAPAPEFGSSDVVIPPGESYDVVIRAMVPADINLARVRLKYGGPGFGPDTRPSIPLGDVLQR